MYIDGVMRASSTPANSAIGDYAGALGIGAQNSGGTVDMNGWLDELRITKGVEPATPRTPASACQPLLFRAPDRRLCHDPSSSGRGAFAAHGEKRHHPGDALGIGPVVWKCRPEHRLFVAHPAKLQAPVHDSEKHRPRRKAE